MRVRVKHETIYRYDKKASFGAHVIRLTPAAHTKATVLSYNLDVSPSDRLHWVLDPWNNRTARVVFDDDARARELKIVVDLALNIQPVNPFDFREDDRCKEVPLLYPDGLAEELSPFIRVAKVGPKLSEFVEAQPFEGKLVDYLVELNRRVSERVQYLIRTEPGLQSSEETLTKNSGSCRDSAVLLMDALRARGFAARFVSGYLVQLADEGNIPGEAKGLDHDAADLHAWAEVYVPGGGWIGLDGTSGLLCGEGHIPLSATVEPELSAPVTGTASEAATSFDFSMTVSRLGHEARPLSPYPEEMWTEVVAAGETVDETIQAEGLSLTCGGEPTFTSRLHPEKPEWLTEALGETKWTQGLELTKKLAKALGTGVCGQYRQGKLYPGESLPRWALDILWRRDNVPIWKNSAMRAWPDPESKTEKDLTLLESAKSFGAALAKRLGVAAELIPAFEDPWPQIVEEQNFPLDMNPLECDLEDGENRARLSRLLKRGLDQPAGYALPILSVDGEWVTKKWNFKRGSMFLIPGESPMGVRMPLDRIEGAPFEAPVKDVTTVEDPLPQYPGDGLAELRTQDAPQMPGTAPAGGTGPGRNQAADRAREKDQEKTKDPCPPDKSFRTALCFEPRQGVVCVYLPPLESAEAWLELVSLVEATAEASGLPVCLEGYPPPSDPRIRSCSVTPDPGVIEVNMPVCDGFEEYRTTLQTVSNAANHSGLRLEKYQLDGRQAGSGGGNHLTLGGAKAVDSPFLKNPHLLGSLLRYFQNHPALSYLFTGLFVGPTSQAPRLDEARFDALHELELALAQVDAPGAEVPPWRVDRLFRNLLVDVTGNTHRTEVCIDKLYSPDGPAGRLGIVELRAFEMPPHERMAAVQMLLVRSLVARFAKAPYTEKLVRWGSLLHDRFMLPHYLWADMADVIRDLRGHDLPLDLAWFRPFLDFRFPVVGRLAVDDLTLELRAAAEPWPTLGENMQGAVVSRPVDASLERLELRVNGLSDSRYVIGVNGVELPLRPTGVAGEAVGGVRFRAWQPPHCLQPHIPIQHPLRFDVVDTWGKRALAGCTYHVIHPEGHGFDAPPLTAFEAAARRAQRFTTRGHAPWPVRLKPPFAAPEQPHTLDLRRYATEVPVDKPGT